jgi:hypothetical protein
MNERRTFSTRENRQPSKKRKENKAEGGKEGNHFLSVGISNALTSRDGGRQANYSPN